MKIYLIAGKQYAVSGDNLYEQVPELNQLRELVDNGTTVVNVSSVERTTWGSLTKARKKGAKKKTGSRGGHRMMHCKVCDGYGHMAKTCPDRKPEGEKIKTGQDEGLIETADVRTQVQELKAEGKLSIEIAKELGITLAEVNKYW